MAEPANPLHLLNRRKALIGLAFAGTAGFAAVRQPNEVVDYLGSRKLENAIPKKFGGWTFEASSGLVIPPEDQLSRATYSQLLTRVYSNNARAPVMLLLAHSSSQTGVLQIHRPETCYPASGYQLSPIDHDRLTVANRSIPVNVLDATKNGLVEHIIYWTRVGNELPLTWAQQKISVARANLRQQIPDAILVRVSTLEPDPEAAKRTLTEFIESLASSVPNAIQRVLFA